MCFRLKTIFGIALIEGVILLVLVWSSLNYLTQSNQEELTKRAETTTRLFAAMTKNPVLSSDLATLDAVVTEMMQSPGVVYVRILDNDRVLAEEGALDALSRPFERDELFEQSADGIFDIDAEIMEGDYKFGRVELGLSVAPLNTLVDEARDRLLSIAALEMVLVAVFSFFFGTYLSRSLIRLAKGAEAIADGKLGTQVAVEDCAEIRTAAIAFNTMSQRLQHSHEEMQRSLADSQALAEQLTQSELRLKTTLDTAINGFITIDQSGIIQSINRVGQEIFGYQEPELIGRNVSCLMPTPYRDEHDGYLKRYLDGGQARVIGIGREALGLRKDGSEFPLSLRVSEMRIGDERMFVGLVSDLSEKRSMEKAISRSTAINSAIMAASLDALITVDDTGAIIDFSPVAEQTFGFQRDEVLGWSISEVIIPPAQRKLHNKWIQRYLRTGQEQVQRRRIEVNAMRRNGEEFPVELTIIPIELDGEVLCTAFVRDISEQKAAENQLREAKRQAEAASEAKSRFLAHMSHEIRSPLNAVLGSVGLLIETTLDENQHLYAHTAETSGKALLGLINDVLDFSKIEAGQLTLEQVKFNLRDLVAGVDEAVGYRVKDKQGLDIISTLGHGIPAQLMGDPGRLRQILLNLMDNAAKFTEQGAVLLRVTALGKNGDRTVLRFEVQDTGIGISKEAQRRLFSEFSQVDNSDSTRYGGTGLGLAICQQLVELMGGHIGLE
ncbi:MAG: PAS domain S-box protein, partial [Candidatus Thiodiazotropha sp.]